MITSGLLALAVAQGAPYRGMVHDDTVTLTSDPTKLIYSTPVAGLEGRNFAVALVGRVPNDLHLFDLTDGKAKSIKDFGPDLHAFSSLNVHARPDGGFWAVARAKAVSVKSGKDADPLVTRFDGLGKLLLQNKLDVPGESITGIANAAGDLFIVSKETGMGLHATMVGADGKVRWSKPLADSKLIRYASMTFVGTGDLIVFGERPRQGSQTTQTGLYMAKVSAADGSNQSTVTSLPGIRSIGTRSTGSAAIAYTSGVTNEGQAVFYVCSIKSLSPTKAVPFTESKSSTIGALFAHPKRGVYVGVNTEGGPNKESMITRISYGGKVMSTFPATFLGSRSVTTAFKMDRYEDVYAAGEVDGGAFLSKLGRPDGLMYRQFLLVGTLAETVSPGLSINSDTGDVLMSRGGQVAAFAQSPLLYEKTVDAVEDQPLKAKNCLDNDRYTMHGNVVVVTAPRKGKLVLKPNGDYVYTPNPGFVGIDGFTYRVHRGNVSSFSGTVIIKVAAANKG